MLAGICRYESTIPTFTDVLLRYERDTGQRLFDLYPIIAIGGVPGEQSMQVERTRWVISRAGLTSVFGMAPVIINEVAAQAWALRTSLETVTPVHGGARPDLTRRGRYVFMTYEEGVGTVILDVDDDGRCTVLEAEGGQLDFVPVGDEERALLQSVAGRISATVSWEQILMLRRDALKSGARDSERLYARLLGRFVSNLIYSSGAWNGAFLTGRLVPRPEEMASDFVRALTLDRPYSRQLAGAKCWRTAQTQAVLKGCAAMLADRYGAGRPPL